MNRWLILLAALVSLTMAAQVPRSFGAEQPPQVLIQTNMGDIVLELNPEKAPKTVENFLNYVKSGFYDNTIFHRVIDGFMIQGGGYTRDFTKKTTNPPIRNEADNHLRNDRGTVAMARTGDPHSATSQFFINVADNDFLNHKDRSPRGWGYTVFGKVIKGMDVVDKIKSIRTGPRGPFPKDVPQSDVIIEKMTLLGGT